MPVEAWRNALTRWGDPLWTLAVITTGQNDAARTVVIDTFCSAYRAAVPDDPEQTLYSALIHRRVRFDRLRRRPLLSRALRRLAPADRLLLGLWLLREQTGEQLCAISGLARPVLIERLAHVVTTWAQISGKDTTAGTDLVPLVEERLDAAESYARSRVYGDRTTPIDQLQSELLQLTRALHLPADVPAQVERSLDAARQTASVRWWQRRVYWQLGLVVLTLAVLVMLIVPGRNNEPESASAPPTEPKALVQAVLDRWGTPGDMIVHRRVWAIDPMAQQADAVVTDVWLAPDDDTSHRIEVHRGQQLVEWQLADGDRRLNYGAIGTEATCAWALPVYSNQQQAVSYRISPADQRIARDVRLTQGAYGLGRLALERALAAPDLRSFGTRVVASRTFVTLIYSDTFWGPAQDVVLRIDPDSGELYGVQTVAVTGAQTRTRDLWRLDANDDVEFIPTSLPRWATGDRSERVIDPSCLMLGASDIEDLRSTLDPDALGWYLPLSTPQGMERGAFIAASPPTEGTAASLASIQWTGPGRFLSISPVSWQPLFTAFDEVEHGQWRVTGRVFGTLDLSSLTLHLRPERNAGVLPRYAPDADGWTLEQSLDGFVATIFVSSQGMSEDEVFTLIDQLAPATPATWKALRDRFVTALPMDPATQTVLDKSIDALAPPGQGTIVTTARTTLRQRPALAALDDPYHIAADIWSPQATEQRQTLVYSATKVIRFGDWRVSPDGNPFVSQADDGARFMFVNYAQGWSISGDAIQLGTNAVPVQPSETMLRALLGGDEPLTLTQDARAVIIERTVERTVEQLNDDPETLWSDEPWTAGLPAGALTYRVWFEQSTGLPERMEITHETSERTTAVTNIQITERRVNDDTPTPELPAQPSEPDILPFRWVTGKGPMLVEKATNVGSPAAPFVWTEANDVVLEWQLQPVGASEQLSMSVFQAPRWFNLSRLSAIHRALYRVDADFGGILVTQGPKNLMQHIIRYSEMGQGVDAIPWTASRRLTVRIHGLDREAWLLSREEVAALVIDMDDRLIHVMGLRTYLGGPMLPLLEQLNVTQP